MNERLIATRTHAYVVAGSVATAWKAQQAYMHGMRTCTATCTGNIWLGHVRLLARSAVTVGWRVLYKACLTRIPDWCLRANLCVYDKSARLATRTAETLVEAA